jgi:regulator of PEP synthase PpsR (kinase-PPPase family)
VSESIDQSRAVFFISDRTGLTAEAYGRSLLAQFPGLKFDISEYTFIDNAEKADNVAEAIDSAARHDGVVPLVFTTLVEPQLQTIIAAANACIVDLFSTFIEPLEGCLGRESAHKQGLPDSLFGGQAYQQRLNAIDYAMAHDDGVRPDQYPEADVILVGVSRCGKTPTSLYLAMNFYIKAANYPLLDSELETDELPPVLQPLRDKLVALTIQPLQLSNIREQRRPGSDYAALAACQQEVRHAESIFRNARLPVFETTATSIEEIAGWIMKEKGLQRPAAG